MKNIHPTAIVHKDAQLGSNVCVGPYAIIEAGTVLGKNVTIHAHAIVHKGARIGDNCQIYAGACIAAIPQDLKYKGEETEVVVGAHTIIREYVTISKGTQAKGTTQIGKHCLLMAYTHIAHDCIVEDHCIISNNAQIGGHVHIENWVTIGGACAIHQFSRVGLHAMVAAFNAVKKDVPPYSIAGKCPMRFYGINIVGLQRRNFSKSQVAQIKEIYNYIYSRGLNTQQALQEVSEKVADSEEKRNILRFIQASERGIIPG